MRGYLSYTEQENWSTKAKKTIAGQFNGEAGFKVTYDEANNQVNVEKDGVSFPLNFSSVGYTGTIIDLNVTERRYGDRYKTIGRITPKSDLYASRLKKGFREYATSRFNSILSERITAPALEKSQKQSAKTFEQWKKANEKYTSHDAIRSVEPETNWNGSAQTQIGTDKIITTINAYAYKDEAPPTITQIFGIIVQSGIKVKDVGNSVIQVVGTAEETEKFLEILNKPLEWKY